MIIDHSLSPPDFVEARVPFLDNRAWCLGESSGRLRCFLGLSCERPFNDANNAMCWRAIITLLVACCSYLIYHTGHENSWQGKYDKAESLYARAQVIFEKAVGGEHPSVAGVLANQAVLSYQQVRSCERFSRGFGRIVCG